VVASFLCWYFFYYFSLLPCNPLFEKKSCIKRDKVGFYIVGLSTWSWI
jgi:hypothetical protein